MSFKIEDCDIEFGGKLVLIAGPCVIESESLCLETAEFVKELAGRMGFHYIFKASYDKANRTSLGSFRGPGIEAGLDILASVKQKLNVSVLTDVHEPSQAAVAAEVADILQIPAFLCRQTDLLVAAGETGKPVNIKKGQFMAAEDMRGAVEKVASSGNDRILLTERGSTFGYHNLVVDMRSLGVMRELAAGVVFDATHSVQLPGGLGGASGGQKQFVAPLARAATAVGIDALFVETHPNPAQAKSDGPNSLDFQELTDVLTEVKRINDARGQS